MSEQNQLWLTMEKRAVVGARDSIYRPLFDELTLRLERTPPDEEILVTFRTPRHARSAQRTLHKMFAELRGSRAVRIGLRDNQIAVRRGKHWPGKRLAKLPKE